MTKSIAGALFLFVSLFTQSANAAPLVNGGFESGDLTGWSLGIFFIQDSGPGAAALTHLETPAILPREGKYMAMLSSGGLGQTLIPDIGPFLPAINHGLPLGVTSGAGATIVPPVPFLCGPFCSGVASDFAQLQQEFSITGARRLSFEYNFLTNEVAGFDVAFVSIEGPLLTHTEVLGFGGLGGASLRGEEQIEGRYGEQRGWDLFEIDLRAPGSYTLNWGIVNTIDPAVASALLIDNVQLVSEPGTLLLIGLGLAGLVRGRRISRPATPMER